MIIVTDPALVLIGALIFFVFVVPYWWIHYGPEGQSFRAWLPGLLVVAGLIGAILAWVALRS